MSPPPPFDCCGLFRRKPAAVQNQHDSKSTTASQPGEKSPLAGAHTEPADEPRSSQDALAAAVFGWLSDPAEPARGAEPASVVFHQVAAQPAVESKAESKRPETPVELAVVIDEVQPRDFSVQDPAPARHPSSAYVSAQKKRASLTLEVKFKVETLLGPVNQVGPNGSTSPASTAAGAERPQGS